MVAMKKYFTITFLFLCFSSSISAQTIPIDSSLFSVNGYDLVYGNDQYDILDFQPISLQKQLIVYVKTKKERLYGFILLDEKNLPIDTLSMASSSSSKPLEFFHYKGEYIFYPYLMFENPTMFDYDRRKDKEHAYVTFRVSNSKFDQVKLHKVTDSNFNKTVAVYPFFGLRLEYNDHLKRDDASFSFNNWKLEKKSIQKPLSLRTWSQLIAAKDKFILLDRVDSKIHFLNSESAKMIEAPVEGRLINELVYDRIYDRLYAMTINESNLDLWQFDNEKGNWTNLEIENLHRPSFNTKIIGNQLYTIIANPQGQLFIYRKELKI
jgi:hypothetical protein